MKISTDHLFWAGDSHKVNQDYCLSGIKNGIHYAIVSDGCSSNNDTDFGSRILAKAAENNIEAFHTDYFEHAVISEATVQIKSLNLRKSSLNATLLIALYDDFVIRFRCYGDGFCSLIHRDKEPSVLECGVESGAPLYLNYLNDNKALNEYYKEFGFNPVCNVIRSEKPFLNEKRHSSFCYEHDVFSLKAVVIGSDGFKSYYKMNQTETSKTKEFIDSEKIYNKLLGFKNINGAFIERRAARFISDCKKEGWMHFDDCSLAGISFREVS